MSFALFRLPIDAEKDDLPVLLMGIDVEEHDINALVVNDEGVLQFVPFEQVKTNWRYDWRVHKWIEVGDLSGSTENDAPDGGEDLSGSVPEPD